MKKKDHFTIIFLTIISFLLGSISIYLYVRVQYAEEHLLVLKKLVSEHESQRLIDSKNLAELGVKVDHLKNALDHYSSAAKNPLYEEYKKQVTALIEKNFSKIVKKKKGQSGQLFMTRIRFVGPDLVDVKYEDGHNIFDTYIRIIKPVENFQFEEVK